MNTKPNILLITADQHRADCFGFAGRNVQTPHLDQLAAAGTRFEQCITPNAVCQPARASMLTGLFPRTHGVFDNGIDLKPALGEAGFSGQLSQQGVATGFIGKAHFSTQSTFAPTGTPECRESSADYPTGWRGPWMGFDHFESVVHSHDVQKILHPPQGLAYEERFWGAGAGEMARGKRLLEAHSTHLAPDGGAHNTWHSALPVAWHHSSWVADRSIAYLQDHRDEPFCLWASFPDPHDPMDCPHPWSRMHHPDEVDLPRHRVRDFERRPWWYQKVADSVPDVADPELRARRSFAGRSPLQNDEQLRHIIANYYSMISLVDHNTGRILNALAELGLAENTLVIYTSDHGDWLGDHGLVNKGPLLFESVLRVGMILRGPGIPAGGAISEPVATTDLTPTILAAQGLSPASPVNGRSLLPLINAPGNTRDFAYHEWDVQKAWCGFDMHFRTVRSKDAKLTIEALSGEGELYDLANDPDELENRFHDPDSKALRRELEGMLRSRPDDVMEPRLQPVGTA